jgi:hypothetical protein
MANRKIKAEVHVNDEEGGDVNLEMSDYQARVILDAVLDGRAVTVNLVTAAIGEYRVSEEPAAYAQ